MQNKSIVYIFVVLLFFCWILGLELKAAESTTQVANNKTASSVKIENWLDGKKGAVSLTFDDGASKQRTLIIPELNKRQLRGTFFLITGHFDKKCDKWENWYPVITQGHEIGSHSISHPPLNKRSRKVVINELKNSKIALQKNLGLDDIVVFAYPGAKSNAETDRLCAKYYLGSRSFAYKVIHANPTSLHSLPSLPWGSKSKTQEFNNWVDKAIASKGWVIELFHSVNGQGWEPPSLATVISHFDYLASKSGDIWVAPMGEVVKYIIVRQASKISVLKQSEKELQLQIKIDGKIPHSPPKLSISFMLPKKSKAPAASFRNKPIPVKTIRCDGEKKGIINITPSGGTSIIDISF